MILGTGNNITSVMTLTGKINTSEKENTFFMFIPAVQSNKNQKSNKLILFYDLDMFTKCSTKHW